MGGAGYTVMRPAGRGDSTAARGDSTAAGAGTTAAGGAQSALHEHNGRDAPRDVRPDRRHTMT